MNAGDEVVEELREALAPELVLLERLGGGMGDVYLARDPILKRTVAVKVLSPRLGVSPPMRQRFAREAEAAAAVAHPNVVPIHRVGTLPRSQLGYIVMAYVEGPTLREMIPAGGVGTESDVRRIMAQVAAALAAAHARGVVHRDIKPANILYDQQGGQFVVVDFGIASVLNRDTGAGGRITMDGFVVGTPEYMSPEQAAGDPVAERSDIYSLGCLAYELLTGKPPATGATPAAVLRAHLYQKPEPIGTQRSDISADFAGLVMRCLRKEPAERPDAEEVARALGVVRRAVIEWPPPGLEALHRQGAEWTRAGARFAVALFLFVLILGIHPAAARPCCADLPDRSPGWLLLKRLSTVTPIHFDDPDALSIWYFLLDASFFVALAALIPFAVSTARLANRLLAGRRIGYPRQVLARVAWDRHRDTRELLNLTHRYALVTPEAQTRQIRRRALASGAISLSFVALIATCLAWLAGGLDLDRPAATGLLPLGELLLVAGPAAGFAIGYLGLEAFDLRQRRTRGRRPAGRRPLRRDVRDAWIASAGVDQPAERWTGLAVRGLGIVTVAAGLLTVIVAAYALIAVFGASARFAGDRSEANEWLRVLGDSTVPDSVVPPLTPNIALALGARIPLEPVVGRLIADGGRIPADARRMLTESIGPAFCLNPREVLFGPTADRLSLVERVAGRVGVDPTARRSAADSASLGDGGFMGLRRRARYCERFFGDQATISPAVRPRG